MILIICRNEGRFAYKVKLQNSHVYLALTTYSLIVCVFTISQVTLSLEEKQRIAKQQEQQRFMQATKPLEVKSSTANKPKQTSSQPKDLTNSLMQSNMMKLSLSASTSTSTYNGSSGLNMQSNISGNSIGNRTSQSPMGSSTYSSSTLGMNQGGLNPTSGHMFSQNSFGQGSSSVQRNKPVDLSSFDNLLPSSSQKQTMSLGQMGQRSTGANMPNQGMMGNQWMGQQGMMGTQSMSGQPAMMAPSIGGQGMMNSGFQGQGMGYGYGGGMNFQQGSMTSQGGMIPQAAGQSFMQQQTPLGIQSSSNMSVKNELDDLFG